jgi:hypothetical protein
MILAVVNQAAVTGVLLAVLAGMIIYFVRHENRKSAQRSEKREEKAGREEATSFGPDWDSSVEEEESRSVAMGFTPRHTAEYRAEAHSPQTTQVWEDDEWSIPHRARPEGFTREEAKLWRDAGYTAREARRLSQEHTAPPPRSGWSASG